MIKADICVIGAGSAGLTVAAGAAQMGARTVLIEAGRMGGDCLNTGCVPSKSLIAAAKLAHMSRTARRYGIRLPDPEVEFAAVNRYVQGVIGAIAPHDSIERFEALGVTVIRAQGRFIDKRTVVAGEQRVRARRFVIATGSSAAVPEVSGLESVPYFTNETLFDNTVLPEHLIVIGAGPIGCEMAQAHRRLGARVTVIDINHMLPKDDPEAVGIVRQAFTAEGITLHEKVRVQRVEKAAAGLNVILTGEDGEQRIAGSHLLVAAGRKPNIESLGLEAAGVCYGPKGLDVSARLRTSNPRIYAAGDVAGGFQFTHLAGYHAGIVLRNALFRVPAKTDLRALPWVTYTNPEIAQVGLTEAQAQKAHGKSVSVLRAAFSENDRAQTEGTTDGFIKIIVGRRGEVLGATIVGPQAGELILLWALAMSQRLRIGALATVIAPYPTLSEISKRAAGTFYTSRLFSRSTRALVRFLGLFG